MLVITFITHCLVNHAAGRVAPINPDSVTNHSYITIGTIYKVIPTYIDSPGMYVSPSTAWSKARAVQKTAPWPEGAEDFLSSSCSITSVLLHEEARKNIALRR